MQPCTKTMHHAPTVRRGEGAGGLPLRGPGSDCGSALGVRRPALPTRGHKNSSTAVREASGSTSTTEPP